MKTKYILYIAAMIALSGCSKNLEKLPESVLSEQAFWKSSDDAVLGVNGIYNSLAHNNMYGDFMRHSDAFTDNAFSQFSFNYYLEISQNKGFSVSSVLPNSFWTKCYEGVVRANKAITNVPAIPMDEALKTRLLAEAHFLRALYYFHLTNLWGAVPLVLDPQTVNEQYVSRTPKAQVITQILSDIDYAETNLPPTFTGANVGRATKGAAIALKSRVKLYNKDYAGARDAANQLMTMGYDLAPAADYADIFLPTKENTNKESIFEVQYLGGTGSGVGSGFNSNSGALANFSNTYNPEKDLADAYTTGDIRLAATILKPGQSFGGVNYTGTNSPTGLAVRKSIIADATVTGDGGANFVVFRYAEILLTYAEAQNELLSAPDQSVYNAINKVRARAGLLPLSGLTKEQMLTAIKKERRLEFAFEGQHFFDLLRWGAVDYKAAMDAVSNDVPNDVRTYEDKLLLWPVPQAQVTINANLLPQNKGW
ncbi:RagB/SusD family nutrient uptake outer membrane protein [Pedobacter sp. MW01-1-1]|uniref:RagB/SusD family nutrient uptake outer membrane protein n=1 Tax=Pedobacter sp. MW01-1-1 TaxID=3383027 RepID=UPI003FEFA283